MPSSRVALSLAFAFLASACADKAASTDAGGGASGSGTTSGGTSAQGGAGAGGGSGASGGTTANGGAGVSGGAGTNAGGTTSGEGGTGGLGAAGAGAGASGAAGSDAGAGGTSGAGASGGTPAGGMGGTSGSAGGGGLGGAGNGGAGNAGAGGAAMAPFKGVANSPCNVRTALGVSWYYNWTQSGDTCAAGGEFVPMIWGHTGAEQTASSISSAVTTFVNRGNKNVLAFNEPDNPTQSNIPVNTAISLWPSFDNAAIRVGSPGTAANANPGQAWFTSFMTQLNANAALRADFLAIHWYGWNAGSCDANASQLESYVRWAENFAGNRPIWITEFGCLNQSRPDTATVLAFYRGALAMFARHPRIQRYAWYPWEMNLELANSDGSLTELGMAYAAAPAFK